MEQPVIRRAALLALLLAQPLRAALTPAELGEAGARPPAGAMLPRLPFVDQRGGAFRLAPAGVPTVLLFADYTCRHICGPGMTLAAGALHDAGLRPGRDYRMVVIGLDGDGPAAARAMVAERLASLPEEARGIEVLTGAAATVAAAERALGYHAVYDRAADQFAHDAALYVFAADGRLAALLPETFATPTQLKAAVQGSPAAPPRASPSGVGALCYGLATMHGPYAAAIVAALRGGGALIAGALAFLLWRALRRARSAA